MAVALIALVVAFGIVMDLRFRRALGAPVAEPKEDHATWPTCI